MYFQSMRDWSSKNSARSKSGLSVIISFTHLRKGGMLNMALKMLFSIALDSISNYTISIIHLYFFEYQDLMIGLTNSVLLLFFATNGKDEFDFVSHL